MEKGGGTSWQREAGAIHPTKQKAPIATELNALQPRGAGILAASLTSRPSLRHGGGRGRLPDDLTARSRPPPVLLLSEGRSMILAPFLHSWSSCQDLSTGEGWERGVTACLRAHRHPQTAAWWHGESPSASAAFAVTLTPGKPGPLTPLKSVPGVLSIFGLSPLENTSFELSRVFGLQTRIEQFLCPWELGKPTAGRSGVGAFNSYLGLACDCESGLAPLILRSPLKRICWLRFAALCKGDGNSPPSLLPPVAIAIGKHGK